MASAPAGYQLSKIWFLRLSSQQQQDLEGLCTVCLAEPAAMTAVATIETGG
jgi:hypothetical protein